MIFFTGYFFLSSFISSYLNRIPGRVSTFFEEYQADTCLRFEDLPYSFTELAHSFGVDASEIEMKKPVGHRIVWNSQIRRQVLEAEKEMVEHYDYY